MEREVKNVLVTGGAGFIGSAFIRYLFNNIPEFQGFCVNLDLLTYAGREENLSEIAHHPKYVFQKGDIRNQSLVERLCFEYQIDTIVHFAAESHVDRSIDAPHAFIDTNVMGTFHLLEVVRKIPKIHFHHISTDEVFGCLKEEGFFSEESPYKPNSPYSASKAASDHLVRSYANTYGISTCISNCSNNYGPFQHPEKFIPRMITNCLEKKPLPIYGQGQNIRDWLYVDDHAEAIWALLHLGKRGETYCIGGESEWRNIDLVRKIIEIFSLDENYSALENLITFVTDRPGHDYRYAIDCSKIKTEIGWKPKHSLELGLRKTIQHFQQNLLGHKS